MKTQLPDSVALPEFIRANSLFMEAVGYAHQCHSAVNQVREGTGEPYIVHPIEVAGLVHTIAHDFDYPIEWIEVAVVAALLHDVIEDTRGTYNEIESRFGAIVRDTVFWLTDVTTKAQGNRRVRKELERVRLSHAPGRVKFIKCCDIIANARTVLAEKPGSAQLFLTEKLALIDTFAHYNRLHKGVEDSGKLDKKMLARCRLVLVQFMDTISKP